MSPDGRHNAGSRRQVSAPPAAYSDPGSGAQKLSAQNGARASRSGCKVCMPRQRQCRAALDRSRRDAARMGLQHRCLARKRAACATACAPAAPNGAAAETLERAHAALSFVSYSTPRSVRHWDIVVCRDRAARSAAEAQRVRGISCHSVQQCSRLVPPCAAHRTPSAAARCPTLDADVESSGSGKRCPDMRPRRAPGHLPDLARAGMHRRRLTAKSFEAARARGVQQSYEGGR